MLRLALLLCGSLAHAASDTLVLAYPEREKEPYIAEMPSNQGVYQDLFQLAAKQSGLKLKIVRYPKKRIFSEMQQGKVDLYPGSFSIDRAAVMNWVENGLVTQEVCLTRPNIAPLNGLKNTPPMKFITEIGSSKANISATYPQLSAEVLGGRVDMALAIRALQNKRGELFIIEQEPLQYYFRKNHIASAASLGLRLHLNCLPQVDILLLGIAKASKHYAEIPNPNYQASQALSVDNLPTLIDPTSKAGQFAKALRELKASGKTQQLLDRYMQISP